MSSEPPGVGRSPGEGGEEEEEEGEVERSEDSRVRRGQLAVQFSHQQTL